MCIGPGNFNPHFDGEGGYMGPTIVGGWIGSKWISTTTPGLSSFAVPFFNFNIHVRLHFVPFSGIKRDLLAFVWKRDQL